MTPSRNELYLMKIAGEQVSLPAAPLSRNEAFLAFLADKTGDLPTPQSRIETYLAKCCGMDVELPPEPLSETEVILAYLAGMDVELPVPSTRINTLLKTIIDNGGFDGGGDEDEPLFRQLMSMHCKVFTDPCDMRSMGDYVFAYDEVIEEAYFPKVTQIPTSCFENAVNLRKVVFPEATRNSGNRCFMGCSKLEEIRLPSCTSALNSILTSSAVTSLRVLDIKTSSWNFDVSTDGKCLETVILRGTSVVSGTPAFHPESPIALGTGHILVQPSLVDSYKAAAAWSNYAAQIEEIES